MAEQPTTFGLSAFLKLLSLSDRRRGSELKKRLGPARSSGYDFHKRMRYLARRLLVEGASRAEVPSSAEKITRSSERLSAIAALERLDAWRKGMSGDVVPAEAVIYESPRKLFRVKFEPDFARRISGRTIPIHLWNTKSVRLDDGSTYAALSLVTQAYDVHDHAPDDVGVLSIREPVKLYLLSDVPDRSAVAAAIVNALEEAMLGTGLPPPRPEDRPSP